MSDSCWSHWIERLLFGCSSLPPAPPNFLKDLILRMEAENIPWSHILCHGGFTAFPYQIHGDLNYLIDYLEKQWLDQVPPYKLDSFLQTRAVSKFWNQLQSLLAKRDSVIPFLPLLSDPPEGDDAILKQLLDPPTTLVSQPYSFQSATFWGNVAQRFMNLRRPEKISALLPVSHEYQKRVLQLYDITCVARGHVFDPLTLYLVHHSEYVNAVHWQSPENLEAFMHDRPSHHLTLAIQALLKTTVQRVLNGEKPSTLLNPGLPQLDALLHNIRVIHNSVQQVPHANTPPKLIDVFQRLLALNHRDGLWEKSIPVVEIAESPWMGTSILYLTEQLRIAEREKHVLWKHVTEKDGEISDRELLEHTWKKSCDNREEE